MNIIGKTTINPIIFYTGKICGYLLWIVLLGYLLQIFPLIGIQLLATQIISILILSLAIIIIILSFVYLGKSVRLGLPSEETKLKTDGIYRISRNPMYLGFNLLTIASMLYCINIITFLMGIYCLTTYHLIIIGEEYFLKERFGEEYMKYLKKVRRYI
jgi:protein-S-isoprenylcysteine O-methyltransferase Ste14